MHTLPGLRSFAAVAVLLVAGLPPNAGAQRPAPSRGGSVFQLVDAQGQRLEVGSDVQGALSSADYRSLRDNYVDVWTIAGRAGTSVTLDLVSDAFDPVLYVAGPGFGETLRDDDGGGGCNARLSVTFLEQGTFHVMVSSTGSRQTGVYTLRTSEMPSPVVDYPCGGINPALLADLPTTGRAIAMGDTAYGRLSPTDHAIEGRYVQAWAFEASAGQSATLLLLSPDFDTYLYVLGPGLESPMYDDDGAGDLDSRIDVVFPAAGTYRVVATALSSGATGAYTLIATETRAVTDLRELDSEGRTVTAEQPARGVLGGNEVVYDGRPVQAWAYMARAGVEVEVTLESGDFDAYLYVIGPDMMTPLSDDDGGDGLNSRIRFTSRTAGRYLIVAAALSMGRAGDYTLSVRETRRPDR